MNFKVEALNEKEKAWIAQQSANAKQFVDAFSAEDAGLPLSLAALDRAFTVWMKSEPGKDEGLINAIINAVGVAFGSFLVEGIGLSWVIAADQSGSDLAVYGFPGRGDILVYPANFVAKRWERREGPFLERSYAQIEEQVQALKRAHQKR